MECAQQEELIINLSGGSSLETLVPSPNNSQTYLQAVSEIKHKSDIFQHHRKLVEPPAKRLRAKLKDSTTCIENIKPQLYCIREIPKEGNFFSLSPDFIMHTPYKSLRKGLDDFITCGQDINPGTTHSQLEFFQEIPKQCNLLTSSPECTHLPIEKLCERFNDSISPTCGENINPETTKIQLKSSQKIPQESEFLPESQKLIRASINRLREKLNDATTCEGNVNAETSKRQLQSSKENKRDGEFLPEPSESLPAPFKRSHENNGSVTSDEDITPLPESKRQLHRFETVQPEENPLLLREKETHRHMHKKLRPGRLHGEGGHSSLIDAANPATQSPHHHRHRRTENSEPTSSPLPQSIPLNNDLLNNAAGNTMSINCTSCTVNYNYESPNNHKGFGILLCEIIIVIVFAFFIYTLRKN